jgi:hypothetical protein
MFGIWRTCLLLLEHADETSGELGLVSSRTERPTGGRRGEAEEGSSILFCESASPRKCSFHKRANLFSLQEEKLATGVVSFGTNGRICRDSASSVL